MEEKFEYFMEQTNERLSKIDRKLDQLISFRLFLVGAAMAVSAIVSLAVEIFVKR